MAGILFFAGLILLGPTTRAGQRYWPQDQILAAIRFVETSDQPSPPDGDDGLAIGPFQIHPSYWLDAHASDPSLGGSYQDCRDL